MPSNWFQITYYGPSQTRGRPRVKLAHKRGPEVDSEFTAWCQAQLPPGARLRSVTLFIPTHPLSSQRKDRP